MSTSAHQFYLRKFAKQTESILFTVDYPKAPKVKYTEIFMCIIKFYLFLKVYLENVIKKKDYKIIFVGDSAGGNLVVALT